MDRSALLPSRVRLWPAATCARRRLVPARRSPGPASGGVDIDLSHAGAARWRGGDPRRARPAGAGDLWLQSAAARIAARGSRARNATNALWRLGRLAGYAAAAAAPA